MSKLPNLRTSKPFNAGPTRLNMRVFIASAVIIAIVAGFAIITPVRAGEVLGVAVGWIAQWFGWVYISLATVILGFVLWLALSRYGNVRLGPDDSRPEYSLFTWAAMLFAAGIGTDILFFSVAEPVTHYLQPPLGEGSTPEAARQAVVWGLFHYGITGWGMYALVGVALGYFAYRRGLPLSVRSALFPLIGRRIKGSVGDAVDTAAVIGTIFGVAASLGIGVVQLSLGLSLLGPIPNSVATQIALVVLAVAMASLSATTGLDRGIRILSELNVVLGIFLGAWVLFTGNTPFLLSSFVTNVGDYVSRFPMMTMDTMSFTDSLDWLSAWTLFFWAWWIAWASFVGMFLARISRGRTIRQFVFGSLIIPFIYVAMWINIFGDDAINLITEGHTELGEAVLKQPEQGIYYLLQAHPGAAFTIGLAVVVGLLFYVTSADSGALVMTNLCSTLASPSDDGSKWVRVFWASVTGVVTIATLAVGGIPALQNATIIMAVPFSFVLIAVMVGLLRAIVDEHRSRELHALTFEDPASDSRVDGIPWRERLATAISVVEPNQARKALQREVLPAMHDVAIRLQQQGAIVKVTTKGVELSEDAAALLDEPNAVTLATSPDATTVSVPATAVLVETPEAGGDKSSNVDTSLAAAAAASTEIETETLADRFPAPVRPDSVEQNETAESVLLAVGEGADRFTYRVRVDLAPSPAFAGHMVRRADLTARLAVSVAGRRSTYDVMGLNRAQMRLDIIDAYERHLNFLSLRHTSGQNK